MIVPFQDIALLEVKIKLFLVLPIMEKYCVGGKYATTYSTRQKKKKARVKQSIRQNAMGHFPILVNSS